MKKTLFMFTLSSKSQLFAVLFFILVFIVIALIYQKSDDFSVNFKNKYTECSRLETSRLRMDCFSASFKKDFQKKGQTALLANLEKVFIESDNASQGGITKCHDAAHSVGMLAGMYTQDIQKTFASCTNICGYGCHMGVIEGYFEMGHQKLDDFPSICRQSSHPYSCVHAVGHFVAHESKDLAISLKACDKIPEMEYRGHCTSGVFMELFEQPIHSDTAMNVSQNLTAFCNSLVGVHRSFCFTMSGYYQYLKTGDYMEGINYCLDLPQGKDICINNFSKALYYKENGSISSLTNFCKKVPSDFKTSCRDGILMAAVLSDPIARHGFELCDQYEGQERNDCFTRLGTDIVAVGGEKQRKELCSGLSEIDKNSCLLN